MIRQRVRKKARIEIIPMIDVVFFLLVFFIISSLAMTRMQAHKVNLPKSTSGTKVARANIVLTIEPTSIWINKNLVGRIEELGPRLADAMRKDPDASVLIQAEASIPYGRIIAVMDEARQVGVRKFSLATEHYAH